MTIRCSQGHENPDGSAFCDECGEPLNAAAPVQQMAVDPNMPTIAQDQSFVSQPAPSAPDMNNMNVADMNAGANAVTVAPADVTAQPDQSQMAPAAVANALQARLIVEADNQEFDLGGKDNITIGREDAVSNIYPDVDLTPHGGEEGGVSRLHARIFSDNGQYMLEDENSTNFTFLNRQRLTPKTPTALHDNDEVRLGRVLLRFKTP